MSACLFCKIAAKEIKADVVFENEHVVAFRDINPQGPTHVLVIPRRHIAKLSELEEGDGALMGQVVLAASRIAKQEAIGDGFRLVVNNGETAGQTVFHIHFHVIGGRPMRWPPG